ncbi:cytochrome c biogenesis CcdA family protein [Microbacterium sp. Root61]|uniref:cytochrome c biogenesis CcdA family protein n=1 Tax=Microbacterium sp. Root61 TaxID=1736570 RepID=UPI000A9AACBE|nr:cytochrome c biogenesis CcdA family protein [Microbacterium sp. Root61]
MIDVGLAGALVGGILTLLSPCSVMLLPAFFAYAFTSPTRLLARTGIFYLGLITTLVPIGVLAGTVGAFVGAHRTLLVTVAAAVIIVLGAVQLLGIPMPALTRGASGEGTGVASVYVLGTVYGLAGVCAGPLLGSVLALAALGGNPLYGGIVLAVFALGMTVPLFVLAFLWSRSTRLRGILRPRTIRIGRWTNTWTQVVAGLLGMGIGVLLIVTEGTASLGGVLGASDQFALESWVLGRTAGVSDLAFALGAIVVLAAAWGVFRWRSAVRRKRATDASAAVVPQRGSDAA